MGLLTLRGWLVAIAAGLLALLAAAWGFHVSAAAADPFTPRQAVLVILRDKGHPAIRDGRQLWALQRALTYRTHAGDTITVPAGMVTDLASVPRPVSPILAPDGPYVQAALVHDGCYATHGTFVWKRKGGDFHGLSRPKPLTRAECDQLLDEAMADIGVTAWQRWAVFGGVRVGGAKGWSH